MAEPPTRAIEPKKIKITPFNFVSVEWITSLLFLGAKRPLEYEDLYKLPDNAQTTHVNGYLDPFWNQYKLFQQKKATEPSLVGVLARKYGLYFVVVLLLQSLSVACQLTLPTFLKNIINYLSPLPPGVPIGTPKDLLINSGVWLSIILVLLQIFQAVFANTSSQMTIRLQVDFKTILIGAVYEKSLRLSQASSRKFTQGQILNIINVDVEKVSNAFVSLALLLTSPIQVVVTVILLGKEIGYAVWGGAGALFGILFLQLVVIGFLVKFQKQFLAIGDRRLKIIREILYGIKIIKFRALEEFFYKRIQGIREEQVSVLQKFYIIQGYFVSFIQLAPIIMPIGAFLLYGSSNNLSPAIIFPSLTLFQGLFQPLLTIPQSLTAIVVAQVSIKRIQQFLVAEEADEVKISKEVLAQPADIAVVASDVSFKWEKVLNEKEEADEKKKEKEASQAKKGSWWGRKKASEPEKENAEEVEVPADAFGLSNVTFKIPRGQKVAVVGAVGTGKSSLLSGLIGEMPKTNGDFQLNGSVGYCAQQPWVLTDTIQGNIVFSLPFDQEKLDRVVQVCGLQSDLDQFPAGILTEIGEKGVNLSGGQKARVALARTLYVNPEIILLDDPISALDAQVGRYVFDHAIKEYLAEKTVILVTHQLHLLPEMDHIIVLNEKTAVEQGSYKELMAKDSLLSVLMKDYRLDEDGPVKKKADEKTDQDDTKANGGIIVDEDKKAGHVDWSVYWHYFEKCGGIPFCTIIVIAAALNAGTQVMTNLWLSWWSANKFAIPNGDYMRVYAYLGVGQFVFALILNFAFVTGCYRAAKFYHPLALQRLLRAPMGFFDSQPIGRILNRMSKDIESIDQNLWILMFLSTIALAGAVASLAFLTYVDLRMLYIAIPLMIVYFVMLVFYQRSNIEFKRYEATLRSPLYSHVSETLSGISTVKAFGVEDNFVIKQRLLMDESNIPTYLRLMASVWINLRLSILAAVLTLGLALAGTSAADGSSLETAGLYGLALTYTVGFAGQLGLLLFASSQLENEFNSVERLKYYCDNLPEEAEVTAIADPKDSEWPSKGEIDFEAISLSYPSRPDAMILKELSFTVKPGEKVGVIGRTGSGKSTLMTALFRLVELQSGRIRIDGIDIAKIGLKSLRRAIQIIPQEPVLFTGTIRENLDVEGLFDDQALWTVLEQIGLHEYVSSLADKLESPVVENGENLSVGQRQLICLGRAILMKPRILIMDEATASVDGEADKLIQESIKTFFAETTVLSIAHRLNTIADFDRVVVLSNGELVEYDSPHALLSNSQSLFSQLADATGSSNAELLRSIALQKHLKKTSTE